MRTLQFKFPIVEEVGNLFLDARNLHEGVILKVIIIVPDENDKENQNGSN